MKLNHIGSLTKPESVTDDNWYESEFRDQLDDLMGKSDVVRAMKDGKSVLLAESNMNGGACDCCRAINMKEVTNWDFYKVEGF